ncbi:hypothetical protein LTR12_003220 [Friedmanniomyces endolithicus]|nr:hypothetical protein LTR12_003220 [Friedmanniomyces endolithicus]
MGRSPKDTMRFPLLSLPAELWAKIGKEIIKNTRTTGDWPWSYDSQEVLCQPAITRTCRVLREELLPHFYASCVQFNFVFDLNREDGYDTYTLQEKLVWLHSIGPANRRYLPKMVLSYNPDLWEPDTVHVHLRDILAAIVREFLHELLCEIRELLSSEDLLREVELTSPPKEVLST